MEVIQNSSDKKSIINCHTHIFTGDHVPPYLAKTFLPAPLHLLLPLSIVVRFFRWYINGPYRWRFRSRHKKLKRNLYRIKIFILRNWLVRILAFLAGLWLTIHAFFIVLDWLTAIAAPDGKGADLISGRREWLEDRNLLILPDNTGLKIAIVVAVALFVKTGRNLILFIFQNLWSFLKHIPGPQTWELLQRYLNIGRFSFHKQQAENFKRLCNQYPGDTGFIVLPMDMDYMDAGTVKKGFGYRDQMKELAKVKEVNDSDKIFPFVFVDPRRIQAEPDFFQYRVEDETVVLEKCFIKEFIEDKGFSGFKIYPALGYYPFEEALLPLWKYAADNGIPIITHCIRGTIFYRGRKKKEWDYHPLFEQVLDKGNYVPLLLHHMKNIDFSNNFTHPLNYLCLLEEKLLRKLVARSKDKRIWKLFGFINEETPLTHDLHHLKICFGHFGGGDEWQRFLESDRDNYSSQLVKQPYWGIDFLTDDAGSEKQGKIEQIWKHTDWYSIICTLMLQYPHVYSDLSYILYDASIQPLLKQTMQNEKLQRKVLFGTDFYVVRNHKSEKHMLADMIDELSEEEFDLMARDNPRVFLKKKVGTKKVSGVVGAAEV